MVSLRGSKKKKLDAPLPPFGKDVPVPKKPASRRAEPEPMEPPLPRRPAAPAQKTAGKARSREVPAVVRNAPMFIKIEKYREVVDEIEKLKSYSLNLRDALDALAEIEKELQTGLALTTKALDRFNAIITVLDSKFLRFQSVSDEKFREKLPPLEIDTYVKDIYDQMEKIRHELKTISA